ncbi:hypothetical protein WA171_006189 [Blastocystis sp. BT1]
MSDSFVLSEDSGKNLRIEPESDDMIARKSSSSSYLFHYPTPHPLPSYRTSESRLSTPDSDMILSSSTSVNELYNPDHVFNFDEQSVYSQHPTYVSTAIEETPPSYLQRDNSYVKEMVGEIEAEKVEVIDEYMCVLLRRVKEEAKLSEVEYGRLLTHIECGEVSDVCNVIEDVLASHDYTPIYQIIYPITDESPSVPGSVENEEDYVPSRICSAAPIHITDIGIQHLPPVFLYKGLLCGEGLVRIKKEWKECFVVIATDTITVYSSLQAWRLRNPPLVFISLCSSMSVSEGMDHDVRYLKLEDLNKSSSRVFMKWKKHVIILEIGSHNATIERFFSEAINLILCFFDSCMHLDFKELVESFALQQTYSWEFFKESWISKGFYTLNDTLKKLGRSRSETKPYVIYLKQCYYFVLYQLKDEDDLYREAGWIYSLYSLFSTQIGLNQDRGNDEDELSSIPVVSIPISIGCLEVILRFVQTMRTLGEDGRDPLTIINQLRESHAFLPCYELLSYEDPKKKQSETEEVLTPQFVANILRLNEYQALETEYKSMTNRNEELGLSEAINQLLQDMPVEAMCQDERPAPTATHSVCIGVLYYH